MKIGYTIAQAAESVGVSVIAIEVAINARQLVAHRVEDMPVILGSDIHAWVKQHPRWRD